MRPFTGSIARLFEGHAVTCHAQVVSRSGTVLADLAVGDDISLTLDSTALVRRHVAFSVVDPQPFMTSGAVLLRGSVIDPSKVNLLRVTISFDGIGSDVQVGLFVVADPGLADPGLTLSLQGYDLAALVNAYRIRVPYFVPAGTNVATAISNLIDYIVPAPTIPKSFASTSTVFPADVILAEGAEPMTEAAAWAAGIGMDLFFDAPGTLVLRAVPDPFTSSAVFAYTEGQRSIMTSLSQTLSVNDSFSHVIALGQAPNGEAPIRADAFDTDSGSSTYTLGPFGDRATVINGNYDTFSTAMVAANAELRRKKGATQVVALTGVPFALHDEQDVITIDRSVSGFSTDKFMIEQATVPLGYLNESSIRCVARRA